MDNVDKGTLEKVSYKPPPPPPPKKTHNHTVQENDGLGWGKKGV